MLHELTITDLVSARQFLACVDVVRSFQFFLLSTRTWVHYDTLSILKAQEGLLEVERATFGPAVGNGEVGTAGA